MVTKKRKGGRGKLRQPAEEAQIESKRGASFRTFETPKPKQVQEVGPGNVELHINGQVYQGRGQIHIDPGSPEGDRTVVTGIPPGQANFSINIRAESSGSSASMHEILNRLVENGARSNEQRRPLAGYRPQREEQVRGLDGPPLTDAQYAELRAQVVNHLRRTDRYIGNIAESHTHRTPVMRDYYSMRDPSMRTSVEYTEHAAELEATFILRDTITRALPGAAIGLIHTHLLRSDRKVEIIARALAERRFRNADFFSFCLEDEFYLVCLSDSHERGMVVMFDAEASVVASRQINQGQMRGAYRSPLSIALVTLANFRDR